MKTVLNVGSSYKEIPLPAFYQGCQILSLDIDPAVSPDILCDARQLDSLAAGQFDAVYCSHNLEHYYRHEVPKVLAGFRHVLRADGFAHLLVPNLLGVMRTATERNLDLGGVLYTAPAGPITVLDVLYGYGPEIERSGQDFFAHKTGFSSKTLTAMLLSAGFASIYEHANDLTIEALAFCEVPDAPTRVRFGLPPIDVLP